MKLFVFEKRLFYFFFKIYLIGIVFFSFFRGVLFLSELDKIDSKLRVVDLLKSFLMGVRFDSVVSGYIIITPYFLLGILLFRREVSTKLLTYLFAFFFFIYNVAFLICVIDIPYFNVFYSRLSIISLQWMESPLVVLKIIFLKPLHWFYILLYLFIIFVFHKLLSQHFKNFKSKQIKVSISSVLSVAFGFVFFLISIRGSIDPIAPIRISAAYFSDNSFLNQLGLNPVFTFFKSYIESKKEKNRFIELMDDKRAVANVRKYLNVKTNEIESPFLRIVKSNPKKPIYKFNVILILMESMANAKLGVMGNKNNLTPFLDSLSTKGYFFNHIYSSGIHTYNGVYSTLTSYPALFMQHPMRDEKIFNYNGIYSSLKKNDYSSIFFTTHDGYFDNIEGFMKANNCDKVISETNYPPNEIKYCFGVPDDYMFRYSIPLLNNMHNEGKPFLATFLTTSDHIPYYIPSYFKTNEKKLSLKATQYADYSIKQFMKLAYKQKWYKNTLFVFVADHGVSMNHHYALPLTYNHIPLLFYSPKLIKNPKKINKLGGQIDVYPTIMGLLNQSYYNYGLGIDLFKENRPYIFFNGDDKYGVIDYEWFLVVNKDKSKYLYNYKNNHNKNYQSENVEIVKKMDLYAKSNLQAYQYFLKNKSKQQQ